MLQLLLTFDYKRVFVMAFVEPSGVGKYVRFALL